MFFFFKIESNTHGVIAIAQKLGLSERMHLSPLSENSDLFDIVGLPRYKSYGENVLMFEFFLSTHKRTKISHHS